MGKNSFPRTFWAANAIELFERWAWYGLFMVLAIYLTDSTDSGALGFSQAQKGILMGTVSFTLYFLPVFTGAIADRVGYKKVLFISFIILSSGYFLLGVVETYTSFFLVFMYVGIGAALFKPVIGATITKTTNDRTSSVGFGIFYWMVNIGAFIGPIVAVKLRAISWDYVFYMSSGVILINFFILFLFYQEPEKEKIKESYRESFLKIFKNIGIAFSDARFVIFLLLIVGFWTMYNQLFYTLPVFIDQWVDTRIFYDFLHSIHPSFANGVGNTDGTVDAEMITNLDAGFIILFQVLISYLIRKIKPLNAMMSGIIMASIGLGLTFTTQNPLYLISAMFIFSIGEMSSSPKITEYIGRIAPKDKVALFIGTSYIPMAGGNFLAGYLSGDVYQNISDKITIIKTELSSKNIHVPEFSESFTKDDLVDMACVKLNMNVYELNTFLWEKYQPHSIWYIFTVIGLGTVLGLFILDKFRKRS